MNLPDLIPFLGRPVTDRELISVFFRNNINIKDELSLNTEVADSFINRQQEGFYFVFTDEAMFLDIGNQAFGCGDYYFTEMNFYSGENKDFSKYTGELPSQLKFTDSRDMVLEKLGKPSWQRKSRKNQYIISERWDYPDTYVHVTYSNDNQSITEVAVGAPEKSSV